MAEENGQSLYVVQAQKAYTHEGAGITPDDAGVAWLDIATVEVPPRTKRKTIIEKAFAEGDVVINGTLQVRVLDEESAREVPISLEEQPPRLKIG
jgi:hypothetical protein